MPPDGYADWLADLKHRIHSAQQRATLAVNRELVTLYWHIGRDILARQESQGWGAKVIDRLAHDLRTAFPDMKGFSRANLMYMRAFAEAWPDEQIVQQAVGQLPWGHNLVLLTRLKQPEQRLAYARSAIEHGWSRNVLNIHIETRLLERTGKAVTNFSERLPAPGSDLARESLKDPYLFDFNDVGKEAVEQILSGLITYLLLAIYCHENHGERVTLRRVRQLRHQIQNEARQLPKDKAPGVLEAIPVFYGLKILLNCAGVFLLRLPMLPWHHQIKCAPAPLCFPGH